MYMRRKENISHHGYCTETVTVIINSKHNQIRKENSFLSFDACDVGLHMCTVPETLLKPDGCVYVCLH